ncbi:MAG: hypothetical protein V4697_00765 [Patescibacteria group bacterium]
MKLRLNQDDTQFWYVGELADLASTHSASVEVEVDDATVQRWQKAEADFLAAQQEMQRVVFPALPL